MAYYTVTARINVEAGTEAQAVDQAGDIFRFWHWDDDKNGIDGCGFVSGTISVSKDEE